MSASGKLSACLLASILLVCVCRGDNGTRPSPTIPVLEAVDLQAANNKASAADQLKQKEMQDLLHWAIGWGSGCHFSNALPLFQRRPKPEEARCAEHSDPDVLKKQADGTATGVPSPERLRDLEEVRHCLGLGCLPWS